jgi:hypothetical protein
MYVSTPHYKLKPQEGAALLSAGPKPTGAEDEHEALVLLAEVQHRLGNEVSYLEWQMLNCHGLYSSAELTPVEGEIMVRLFRELNPELRGVQGAYPYGFRGSLALKLTEIEDKLLKDPSRFIRSFIVPAAALGVLAMAAAGVAHASWSLAALAALILVGLRAATDWDFKRTVQRVKEELPKSNIVSRLGEMDAEMDNIVRYTPVPFSWLFVGSPKRNLPSYVKHMTRHLDWYLRPPARHFHWYWLAHLPAVFVLIGALAAKAYILLWTVGSLFSTKGSIKDYYAASLLLLLTDHVGERYRASELDRALTPARELQLAATPH